MDPRSEDRAGSVSSQRYPIHSHSGFDRSRILTKPHSSTCTTMVSLRAPFAFLSAVRHPFALTRRSALALTSSLFLSTASRPRVSHATPLESDSSQSHLQHHRRSGGEGRQSCPSDTEPGTGRRNVVRMASSSSSASDSLLSTGYLDAESAYALDQELMSTPGFSLEQLMELAGLSVAEAVYAVLPPPSSLPASLDNPSRPRDRQHVVVVCGPGNNGGDGLVAARHLVMFGYPRVTVVYPKPGKHPHYANLVQQCRDVGIDVLADLPEDMSSVGAVVDAIFGFSFRGEPRDPFATILQEMKRLQADQSVLLLSVDVPSGWNVDEGDLSGFGLVPDILVSLTAPKLSAKLFKGRHFVGGRFLPPKLASKYGIQMPSYPGVAQVVEVSAPLATTDPHAGWEQEYAAYLAEREATEYAGHPKNTASPSEESWEAQYAQYLAEKESRET